jgi:hypothetical protein
VRLGIGCHLVSRRCGVNSHRGEWVVGCAAGTQSKLQVGVVLVFTPKVSRLNGSVASLPVLTLHDKPSLLIPTKCLGMASEVVALSKR